VLVSAVVDGTPDEDSDKYQESNGADPNHAIAGAFISSALHGRGVPPCAGTGATGRHDWVETSLRREPRFLLGPTDDLYTEAPLPPVVRARRCLTR
jgi:hypothetical protein